MPANDHATPRRPPTKTAPGVVAPTTRVNIALPFSTFRIQEPSRDLAELAAILASLLDFLDEHSPDAQLSELRDRAHAAAVHLH